MKIRAATVDQAPVLSQLALEAKASWGYLLAQLQRWKGELTLSPESIAQRPTFVAQVQDEIAGFYQLSLTAPRGEIEHFWVKPRFARRGVGRALLSHARMTAAAAGFTQLVIDSDPNAEPFYIACGAECCGSTPAPIQGDPARVRPQLRLMIARPGPGTNAS